MTEQQSNIISMVLMQIKPGTAPISEDMISNMVNAYEQLSVQFGNQPLTKKERDEVIAELHSQLMIQINRGHYVKEKDHIPWYNTARANFTNKFWNRYRLYLIQEQHWNANTIYELDKSTDEIMDLLGNPNSPDDFLRRGLCIGDVQSGKTSTYIGLINKAADANYRVIILLTGTIEKLRRQTQDRIDKGFIGLDSYAFTTQEGSVQVGVGSIDGLISGFALTSTTSDFNAATANKVVAKLSSISDPVIFVLKKNKSVLEKLERWLKIYNLNPVTKKIELPMLLIDDEADNASVNTKADGTTAINKGIRKLLELFSKSNYVGFTATPYANIFIDPDSEQEMLGHDLFPRDFIYALEAPSNYFGARSIFRENAPYEYMLESNDDCENALPLKHKKDDVLKFIPESLDDALYAFFLCNTIMDLRGQTTSHRTMMINISRFIAVQNQITKEIDEYVREIKREVHNYYLTGNNALTHTSFIKMKHVYEKYYQKNQNNDSFNKLQHFTWEEIQNNLYKSIASIEVRNINGGNAPKNLNYEDYEIPPNNTGLRLIAVGGLSLSRGLTLEGLCISYYYRNSTMYDTLMQMGRWFGYRWSYRDLCKIWMPDLSMSWYSYISMATDKLRDEVRQMQNENMTPADFGLAVRSDISGLLVTARNKMRTAQDYEYSVNISGEVIETRYVHSSKDILQRNLEQTVSFLNTISNDHTVHINDKNLELKYPQFLNISKQEIIEFFKVYSVHPLNTNFSLPEIINMIQEDQDGTFEKWDILIASGRQSSGEEPISELFNVYPVMRGFAYRKDTKSIQMSGKNSRLGSKDLAKGGLDHETVLAMEKLSDIGSSVGEEFYFNKGLINSGIKRNPLLVIYPVKLHRSQNDDENTDTQKQNLLKTINNIVIGISIGIPAIKGQRTKTIKLKINKQKAYEIFGIEDDDYVEVDETIPEE